mmetsp:Transcript_18432/g.42056  ORF Transcript_18432/g.42056 Transcript_18432/m.42056 type:complete len:217 (+) Transcript_18432:94-744(+)
MEFAAVRAVAAGGPLGTTLDAVGLARVVVQGSWDFGVVCLRGSGGGDGLVTWGGLAAGVEGARDSEGQEEEGAADQGPVKKPRHREGEEPQRGAEGERSHRDDAAHEPGNVPAEERDDVRRDGYETENGADAHHTNDPGDDANDPSLLAQCRTEVSKDFIGCEVAGLEGEHALLGAGWENGAADVGRIHEPPGGLLPDAGNAHGAHRVHLNANVTE